MPSKKINRRNKKNNLTKRNRKFKVSKRNMKNKKNKRTRKRKMRGGRKEDGYYALEYLKTLIRLIGVQNLEDKMDEIEEKTDVKSNFSCSRHCSPEKYATLSYVLFAMANGKEPNDEEGLIGKYWKNKVTVDEVKKLIKIAYKEVKEPPEEAREFTFDEHKTTSNPLLKSRTVQLEIVHPDTYSSDADLKLKFIVDFSNIKEFLAKYSQSDYDREKQRHNLRQRASQSPESRSIIIPFKPTWEIGGIKNQKKQFTLEFVVNVDNILTFFPEGKYNLVLSEKFYEYLKLLMTSDESYELSNIKHDKVVEAQQIHGIDFFSCEDSNTEGQKVINGYIRLPMIVSALAEGIGDNMSGDNSDNFTVPQFYKAATCGYDNSGFYDKKIKGTFKAEEFAEKLSQTQATFVQEVNPLYFDSITE